MKQKTSWNYKPFNEWNWRNYDEDTEVDINEFIKEHSDDMFFIGTDSQNYGKDKKCIFTSVLIAYKLRRGGSVILHKDKVPFMEHLRQRLLTEAMRSLEVAWHLEKHVLQKNLITIHLDVNKNLKYKSGKYKDELVGLVSSQGYSCIVKPDSWGATKVADMRC